MSLSTLGVGIATGLGLGGAYALIAVSFNLIVASTGYFIFALESVVSAGGILTYVMTSDWHLPMIPTAALVAVVGCIAGALLELVAHRPFERRAADVGMYVLLATIGLSIAIDAAMALLFGGSTQSVQGYVSSSPVVIAGVDVNPAYIVMVAAVAVLTIAAEIVFRRTAIGRNLRAMQIDSEGVQLMGINVGLMMTGVFAVSGALAAFAGFLLTPVTSASATTGAELIVPAFAALALGGFGSFRGAVGGGLVVGLVSGVVPLYVQSSYVNLILLAVILGTLLLRPQGLFSTTRVREL